MTVEKLYRNRLQAAAIFGVMAATLIAFSIALPDPWLGVPAFLAAFAAVLALKVARDSYRLDRGGIGDEEWREIVRAGEEWEKRGYRTPEEVAAGVPPRKEPPEPDF